MQAQDAPSLEDLMLEACHPRQSWNYEDKFEEEASLWSMGSISQVFIKQEQSRKVFHLEGDKIVYIKLKWDAQGKGMILIGFLFYRYLVVLGDRV